MVRFHRERENNHGSALLQDETIKQVDAKKTDAPERVLFLVQVYPVSNSGGRCTPFVRVGSGIFVGREPSQRPAFTVLDATVSRTHFHVSPDASGWAIRDCSSSNGTRVNGEPIRESRLFDQDVVRSGNAIFVATALAPQELGWLEPYGIVACSGYMARTAQSVRTALKDGSNVLILGETGTGKELFASLIHRASHRSGKFVPVNCAAIPESLAEATLFGAVKGAFTGADEDRPGLILEAHEGTLLLDEIGELSEPVQVKLLRALEERTVRPVGATKAIPFDARILAATNRIDAIQDPEGGFRQDLLARLEDLVLYLPPLRQRREEIVLLLSKCLPGFLDSPRYDASFIEATVLHDWPRNARQLLKTIRQVLRSAAKSNSISADILYLYLGGWPGGAKPSSAESGVAVTRMNLPQQRGTQPTPRRTSPGREEFMATWEELEHNISALARHFGCHRKQIYRWLDLHNMQRP